MKKKIYIIITIIGFSVISYQLYKTNYKAMLKYNKLNEHSLNDISQVIITRDEPTDTNVLMITNQKEIHKIFNLILRKYAERGKNPKTYSNRFIILIKLENGDILKFRLYNDSKSKDVHFYFIYESASYPFTSEDTENVIELINDRYWNR